MAVMQTDSPLPSITNVGPPALGAHLNTPTIAEVSCSLSLRGTSGERAGGEGLVPSNCRALLNPLSLTLSPLLRRGERESAAGVVVVSRYAQAQLDTAPKRKAGKPLNHLRPSTSICGSTLPMQISGHRRPPR